MPFRPKKNKKRKNGGIETAVVDSPASVPPVSGLSLRQSDGYNDILGDRPGCRTSVDMLLPSQDSPTLNEQTHRDPSHGGGVEQGMPTTRGLTLSEVRGNHEFCPRWFIFSVDSPQGPFDCTTVGVVHGQLSLFLVACDRGTCASLEARNQYGTWMYGTG